MAPEDNEFTGGIDYETFTQNIGDSIIQDFNEMFDGLGKAGIPGIEEIGESATDIAQAIADRDPTMVTEAVLEGLGVEFKDGEFDLKATIVDNARPIVQKLVARYILNPVKNFVRTKLGFAEAEAEALETQITEEIEAAGFSLEGELGAIAETEVNPVMGLLIGGSQAVGALSNAIASVIQAVNMEHQAYTKGNHTWFTDSNKYKWVRSIPLIGEMADGIARLVEEAKDARAYRRGQTDK